MRHNIKRARSGQGYANKLAKGHRLLEENAREDCGERGVGCYYYGRSSGRHGMHAVKEEKIIQENSGKS